MALFSHIFRKSRIIIKPKLILKNLFNPERNRSYFSRLIGLKSIINNKTTSKRLAIFLIVLLLPISVYAGVVGVFLNNLFKENETNLSYETSGVQNINLLASSIIPNKEFSKAPLLDGDALVSDVGPAGNYSDNLIHRPASDQISVYVVREGDTISQIAEMFDVNVNTIKWGNDLSSDVLQTGQILIILPISGVKHTVVKGDTIESLATKYKGNIEEILNYNNLKSTDSLTVGSVIIIPDGEVFVPPTKKPSVSSGTKYTLKDESGFYIRPVIGGRRSQGIHGYNAVDIAAPTGTEIRAAAAGEVIISRNGGWNGGYGSYIVIRHINGTQTLYAHNSKNLVSAGQKVEQGEVIGLVGSTGKTTGSHVHFEIRGAKNPF